MDLTSTILASAATSILSGYVLRRISRANVRKPLLATLQNEGVDSARRLVEERLPFVRHLSFLKINVQAQKQRVAALQIVGDVTTLRSEIGARSGLLTATIQVDGLALLSLALCAERPEAAAKELLSLAERGEHTGKLARLYASRSTRAFADVVSSFPSGTLPASSRSLLEQGAMEGGTVEVVILRALHRSLTARGDSVGAQKLGERLQRTAPEPATGRTARG